MGKHSEERAFSETMTGNEKQPSDTGSLPRETSIEGLKSQLRELIVEALVLEDVTPADIDPNEPLFVEGLGLDSIDALELAIAIERRYGVKFTAEDEENSKIFATVTSLASYILSYKKSDTGQA
jgi:acyl carrier protein